MDRTAQPAVECIALAHRFGPKWALRGITMRIAAGEIVAVTGNNGSGKSTLLRVIATALRPSRGSARVFGHDVRTAAAAVREHTALVGHASGVYADLTVRENLRFAMRMVGESMDEARISAAIERVNLAHEADSRARDLSAGQQRRVSLARVMLRDVQLLLLDEPYTSFDEEGIARVNDVLRELRARGGSALVITHDLERTRAVMDRAIRLDAGMLHEPSLTPTGAMPAFRLASRG
jgi:heme exporter protein A